MGLYTDNKECDAVIMFACAIGLAISGILMATGGENDSIEEIRELLARDHASHLNAA